MPDGVTPTISPLPPTLSIVIVRSFAGVAPPSCVPRTVIVSAGKYPVPGPLANVAVYATPNLLTSTCAPEPPTVLEV